MILRTLLLLTIMTQNNKKGIHIWTDKHLKYCLKFRIRNVAQTLWKWLLTLGKEGQKIEFTLQEFQQYVKRLQGQSFALHWVKKQFEKLVFLRIINIDKNFGHNTYRIELRHPDATIPKVRKERNLHYHHICVEKQPSNPDQSETGVSSSSTFISNQDCTITTEDSIGYKIDEIAEKQSPVDIKERKRQLQIIKLCARYGILFNPKKPTTAQLFKYPIEEIGESLELYKYRNSKNSIDNPQGFLINCLRYKFYEDSYYCADSFIADMKEVFSNIFKSSE